LNRYNPHREWPVSPGARVYSLPSLASGKRKYFLIGSVGSMLHYRNPAQCINTRRIAIKNPVILFRIRIKSHIIDAIASDSKMFSFL
jgi:hypothetical protein